MERKKKGKDEGKRKTEEKEKKTIPFDVFGYRKERKEKKCESFIFPLFVCKEKRKEMCAFIFVSLLMI